MGSGKSTGRPFDHGPLFRLGSAEQRLRSLSHALLVVLVAFLVSGILVSVGNGLLESGGLTTESAPVLTELVPTTLNFLGLIAVGLAYLAVRNEGSLVYFRTPDRRDLLAVTVGAVGLVLVIVSLDTVLSQFGFQPDENVAVEAGREHPELFLYYLPLVLLLNAPAEELLFRGVVQGLLREAYGIVPGIIAAASLFGLVHYVALVGQGSALAYVAIAFASGILLGVLYEYTQNLVVPTLVHAIWNILVYASLYVEATGGL